MVLDPTRAKLRGDFDLRYLGPLVGARRKRMKQSRAEACEMIGVGSATLQIWELGKRPPEVGMVPTIIAYLGYDPLPEARTFGEQLRNARLRLGLSRDTLAKRLPLGTKTYERWEDDRISLIRAEVRSRLERFLKEASPNGSTEVTKT